MEFAVLAGRALDVLSFEEQDPDVVGHEGRASDGTWRGDITTEKRKFTLELYTNSATMIDGVRSDLALGAHVTFTGDCIGGAVLTVRGYVRAIPYTRNGVTFYKDARLELIEA